MLGFIGFILHSSSLYTIPQLVWQPPAIILHSFRCASFLCQLAYRKGIQKKINHVMKKMQSSHALQEPRMSCLQVLAQPSGSHTHSSPAFSTPNLTSLFENLQPCIALMSCTKKAPHYDIRHKGAVKDILYPPSIFIKALPIPLTACI